jgi:capsular exopolysaccharide synthesis family protein
MGSMVEVMKKVQEDALPDEAPLNPDAPASQPARSPLTTSGFQPGSATAEPVVSLDDVDESAADGGTPADSGGDAYQTAESEVSRHETADTVFGVNTEDELHATVEPAAPVTAPILAADGGDWPAVEPGDHEPEHQSQQSTIAWNAANVDPAVVAFHARYSPATEQFRAVRARLLSMYSASAHRLITITSSVPEEGKSVCSANLAMVMAEGGEHRTLLVDADFRRAAIGRMLGAGKSSASAADSLTCRGLAELIRGEASLDDVLCPTPLPNLKILLPGKLNGEGAADLLASPAAREVWEQLRTAFDYTFLDSPPVNAVSDVSMLAQYCDGVVLVLEMNRTPEPAAQQAVRTLQANHAKILGCILTRHDDRRTRHYDGYYYHREG